MLTSMERDKVDTNKIHISSEGQRQKKKEKYKNVTVMNAVEAERFEFTYSPCLPLGFGRRSRSGRAPPRPFSVL